MVVGISNVWEEIMVLQHVIIDASNNWLTSRIRENPTV